MGEQNTGLTSPGDAGGTGSDEASHPVLPSLPGLAPLEERLRALRPTRPQLVALVVTTILLLGPLVALVAVLGSDATPSRQLIDTQPTPGESVQLIITAIAVNPTAGELRVRLLVQPQSDLLSGGRLARPLTLRVNDLRGETTRSFAADEAIPPVEASIPLTGGAITQYPFDDYEATAATIITVDEGPGGSGTPVPFNTDVVSTVTDFELSAAASEATDSAFASVNFEITRPPTTLGYAVWLMVLMWALAATGVLIAWAVVIWRVEMPLWVFGYFVGVLFALPPLRESLPGRPPPGTIFDFVSFYWSVATVGVSLILLLLVWVRRSRPEGGRWLP